MSPVLSANASLLNQFGKANDPSPVHSHIQSVLATLQGTDSHVSLLEKSMSIPIRMSNNTNKNSQMSVQSTPQPQSQRRQQQQPIQTIKKKIRKSCQNNDVKIISLDKGLVGVLKPHQKEGVEFMLRATNNGGCVLAHCMGLGMFCYIIYS